MAQLVIAAAGAAIGGALAGPGAIFLGLSGAQIGWMAGGILGSMVAGKQRSSGPRLDELRVTGSEYGNGVPWIAGAPRVAGDLIWASDRREIATTEEVGKGGGGSSYTSYTYEIDALYLLADQPDAIVTRCWDNGKLIWTSLASADDESRIASEQTTKWRRITVYRGSDGQLPDPTYDAAVTNAPGYTRRLTVFIEGLQLGSSGTLPNLTFETVSLGDTNPDFVRRAAVADTGVQFADIYSTASGRPAILSIQPTVRVAVLNSTTVYEFDLDGTLNVTTTRELSENYPDGAGSNGTITSYPVGILGGLPVRAMNMGAAFDAEAFHLMAGWKTAAAVGTGFATRLTDGITQTRFLGQVALCSDGVHALVMTAPISPTSSAAVIDQWHLIHFDGATVTNISEGQIEDPITINDFGFGNSTTYHFGCCMLEDDLQHVWWAYGAGEGHVSMYKIESDGILRLRSSLRAGDGLQAYSFTQPSIWAEGGFCVAFSRQSFQAFRRVGDTIGEVPLRDVVESLCDRATMPAGTYDASALASITQPVRALAVSNGSARQALEILQTSHGFDAYVTDKLYFVPRGGSPVLTIDADDLAAGEGDAQDEPFALTVNSDLEIPSRIAVVFKNMSADQINGTEHSERGPTGQDSIQTIQLAIGMAPSEAKGVADAMVRDAYAARLTSQLSLPLTYTHLTPTDVIQVPGSDGTLYRMRITRRSDSGGIIALDVVGDDGEVVIQSMATSTDYTEQTGVSSLGETLLYPLDIPILRDADDSPGYYVAAKGASSPWPGAAVFSSSNTVDYTSVATMGESAVMGTCTTTLGAWTGGAVMDEINSVTVSMGAGELASTTRDALLEDRGLNAMAVGSELIQFMTAELLSASPNVYKLTRLLRGLRGTEWASTGHASSERAVLLTARGLRRVAQQATDVGQEKLLKPVTLGALLADVSPSAFTNTGVSGMPLAPVDPRGQRSFNGDIVLTWARRTRYVSTFCGPSGISVPLDAAAELYDVEFYASGAFSTRLMSFLDIAGASLTHTYQNQFAINGNAAPTHLYFIVYQKNGTVRGRGLQVTMALDAAAGATAQPILVAASSDGYIVQTNRSNDATGEFTTSYWIAATAAGPYSLVQEVSDTVGGAVPSPLFNQSGGRIAQNDDYTVSVVPGSLRADGSLSQTVFSVAPLDLSSAPYAVDTSTTLARPRAIVGDGSRFLLFGEYNKVFESTDGCVTWSELGVMTGATFPNPVGSDIFLTQAVRKIGSRWFLIFGRADAASPVFYTDDADAVTGWTAATGLAVNAVQFIMDTIVSDGTNLYAGLVDFSFGSTVYVSADNGATWASEYSAGFLGWALQCTGTTGTDSVRIYSNSGPAAEKLVGTTSWSTFDSGIVNGYSYFSYAGALIATDNAPQYSGGGSRIAYESGGVFTGVAGF